MSVQVLAIDDSATMRKSLEIAFTSRDFHLTSRATLAEGLEVVRLDRPAVVLIDVSLPEIDFSGSCAALRAADSDVILIALVPKGQMLDEQLIAQNRIHEQVAKPFDCDRLNEVVWRALRDQADRQRDLAQQSAPPPSRVIDESTMLEPPRHRLADVLSVMTGVDVTLLQALGHQNIEIRRDVVIWEGASLQRAEREIIRRPGLRTSLPVLVRDAAEIWESLASRGVVPMDWIGSTQRMFLRDGDNMHPKGTPDIPLIAALASDVDLILTAEALATEALHGPFSVYDPPFVWRVMDAIECANVVAQAERTPPDGQDESNAAKRQLLALGVSVDPIGPNNSARWLAIPAVGAAKSERATPALPAPLPYTACLTVRPLHHIDPQVQAPTASPEPSPPEPRAPRCPPRQAHRRSP
ncbi:MAG: response regulator [Polyangiaceae bacterium]